VATLEQENDSLRRQLAPEGQFGAMIGRSDECAPSNLPIRVAPTDSTVLILGESGNGKDLLAQEIMQDRRVPENRSCRELCGAFRKPHRIELFGYEGGAFTGAAQQRRGKFEQAHGEHCLDEIGDMNPVTQPKSCGRWKIARLNV